MRRCDSRCHTAQRHKCTCICGGANHGCQRGPLTPEKIRQEMANEAFTRRRRPRRWRSIFRAGTVPTQERQLTMELPLIFDDPTDEIPEEETENTVVILDEAI